MKERFSAAVNYVAWVFQEHKKIYDHQSSVGQLKVVDANVCKKTGETSFTIQIYGKNVFPTCTAKELVQDNAILMNFSKSDIKIIMEAVKTDELKSLSISENNIKSVTFHREKKKRVFSFATSRVNDAETKRGSAGEIYADREFLLSLAKKDIADVSYEAGKDSVEVFTNHQS